LDQLRGDSARLCDLAAQALHPIGVHSKNTDRRSPDRRDTRNRGANPDEVLFPPPAIGAAYR
jgi:hypothetical protein